MPLRKIVKKNLKKETIKPKKELKDEVEKINELENQIPEEPIIHEDEDTINDEDEIEENYNNIDEDTINDEELKFTKKVFVPKKVSIKPKETKKLNKDKIDHLVKKEKETVKKSNTTTTKSNTKKMKNPLNRKKALVIPESNNFKKDDLLKIIKNRVNEVYDGSFLLKDIATIYDIIEETIDQVTDEYSLRFMGRNIRILNKKTSVSNPPNDKEHQYLKSAYKQKVFSKDIGEPDLYLGKYDKENKIFVSEKKFDYTVDNGNKKPGAYVEYEEEFDLSEEK